MLKLFERPFKTDSNSVATLWQYACTMGLNITMVSNNRRGISKVLKYLLLTCTRIELYHNCFGKYALKLDNVPLTFLRNQNI